MLEPLARVGCDSSGGAACAFALALALPAAAFGAFLGAAFAFGKGIALDLDSSDKASDTLRCEDQTEKEWKTKNVLILFVSKGKIEAATISWLSCTTHEVLLHSLD